MKRKLIPITTVALGLMATGGTAAAFANPNETPASDLPALVETPEIQSVPDHEVTEQEVEETPVGKPKPQPEPPVKQTEVGGQSEEKPKIEVDPKEKPRQEPRKQERQNPASEEKAGASQQAPTASASRSEGGVNVVANHAKSTVKPAEEKKVASDSKPEKEEKVADSKAIEDEKVDAERTPKTESGGKMPKTAAPGPLVALIGAGIMAVGAGVKSIRFRRG